MKYSKMDISFLQENYRTMNNKDLGKALKRSEKSISYKLYQLKLYRTASEKKPLRNNIKRAVKTEDLLFLRQNFNQMTNRELAKYLGKKKQQIPYLLQKAGLKRNNEVITKLKKNNTKKNIIFLS